MSKPGELLDRTGPRPANAYRRLGSVSSDTRPERSRNRRAGRGLEGPIATAGSWEQATRAEPSPEGLLVKCGDQSAFPMARR